MSNGSIGIIGAGIGGLTAALAIARTGKRVEIHEANHEIRPIGAGLQLSPNAGRILADLGLLPRLMPYAVETERLIVRTGRTGKVLSEMVQGASATNRWGAPFRVIHRGDLQRVLLDAVASEPSISLNLGHQLFDIRFHGTAAAAYFSRNGTEIATTPDVLIAADGLWSKARSFVGLNAPANFAGCVAWRTLVPREAAPAFARESHSNLWLGPGAHIVHYPVRSGAEINIVAIVEDRWKERGWSEPGDIAWINQRFKDWNPDIRALVGCATGWLRWSLFDRAPDWHWTRGNLALLGDAAHPMLPFLAQGAAQAIEDASVLASWLRNTADPVIALKGYEQQRLRRTARVQAASGKQADIYHASGPFALARNLGMMALGGDGMMRRFDWLYGNNA